MHETQSPVVLISKTAMMTPLIATDTTEILSAVLAPQRSSLPPPPTRRPGDQLERPREVPRKQNGQLPRPSEQRTLRRRQ